MKRLLLSASALFAMVTMTVGSASAADIGVRPVFKTPAVVPVFTWTGCYVGGNVGYQRSQLDQRVSFDDTPPVGGSPEFIFNDPFVSKGFAGGFQGGCQLQVNHFVFGIEGDYTWTRGSDSRFYTPDPFNSNGTVAEIDSVSFSVKMNSLYSVRGRIGIADDRAMLYVTAGWAGANFSHTFFLNDAGGNEGPEIGHANSGSSDYTSNGVVVGVGAHYAITNNIIIGAEFLHYVFGDPKYLPNSPATGAFPAVPNAGVGPWVGDHITLRTADQVRIRLDYKTNGWSLF